MTWLRHGDGDRAQAMPGNPHAPHKLKTLEICLVGTMTRILKSRYIVKGGVVTL